MSNQEVFCFFEWRPHRMFQVAVKDSQLQLVHLLLQHLKDKPSAANGDFFSFNFGGVSVKTLMM